MTDRDPLYRRHRFPAEVIADGFVLDVLVQSRRNAKAAKRLMRKLLKGQGRAPRVMITDFGPTMLQSGKSCRVSSIAHTRA